MNLQKILGLIGIALAIVGAFVAIPYVAAILLILGLVVGTLQAFIFLTLGSIYLSAAVAVDEHH